MLTLYKSWYFSIYIFCTILVFQSWKYFKIFVSWPEDVQYDRNRLPIINIVTSYVVLDCTYKVCIHIRKHNGMTCTKIIKFGGDFHRKVGL